MSKFGFFIPLSILFLATFLIPSQAYACSPLRPGSVSSSFFKADAVFSGKVATIIPPEPYSDGTISTGDQERVTFTVYEVYKGPKSESLTVVTALSGISCGYDFEVNKEYLVYAFRNSKNELQTGLGSRTGELSKAAGDLTGLSVLKIVPISTSISIPVGIGLAAAISYALYRKLKHT